MEHNIKDEQNKTNTDNSFSKLSICMIVFFIIIGLIFIILPVLILVNGTMPSKFITNERLEMNEDLPSFKWWKVVEVDIHMRVYVFAVTNAESFLNGTDSKLKFEEIGPIVYREILEHNDPVVHKENSTLSYTSYRYAEYLPDHNEPGILNRTIIVPNLSVLGMAVLMEHKYWYILFGKFNFNVLARSDSVFINTTIYNYLWNSSTVLIEKTKSILPFMIPTENMGVLAHIYEGYNDRVNMQIGAKNGNKGFFKINTYNYSESVPGFNPENGDCFASIVNSSEGASYPQYLTKESVLNYWKRTLCRVAPLHFDYETERHSVVGYKYVLRNDSYDRYANASSDCYKGQWFDLEDGLSDMSKCSHDFPIVASSPHFFARDIKLAHKIEGMKPDYEKHHSYVVADPVFGIPFDQSARVQSNIVIPKISGFTSDIQKFSEMILPMFWIEYQQNELPPQVKSLLFIFHHYIVPFEYYFIVGLFFLGLLIVFILFVVVIYQKIWRQRHCKEIELNTFTAKMQ